MQEDEKHDFCFDDQIKVSGESDIGKCLQRDAADARVIGFGETHGEPNEFAALGASLMPVLKGLGVSAIAIESPDYFQKYLDRFNIYDIDLQELATKFANAQPGHCYPDEPIWSEKQLETDFFRMMMSARAAGLPVYAIDVEHPALVPEREPHLAKGLLNLIENHRKVAYWGGSHHLAKREHMNTTHKTLAERIAEVHGTKAIFSILGISERHKVKFPVLQQHFRDIAAPVYMAMQPAMECSLEIISAEYRGPNGENRQADRKMDWGKFEPRYSDYDALILLPIASK